MDIKPFMSKIGFGRANSRHIVVEQGGKLWLAFASEGAGTFMMSSAAIAAGLLEINITRGGQSIPYTYTAADTLLTLTAQHEYGEILVLIAVDADAAALRIEGAFVTAKDGAPVSEMSNFGLRLDSKNTPQSTTNLNTKDGAVISMGSARYLIAAKRGTLTFDDSWIRNQFKSAPPVVDIAPDDGKLKLVVYDLAGDTPVPPITKSIDECAKENADDFAAFKAKLADAPKMEIGTWYKNAAYSMWVNQRVTDGAEIIVANKLFTGAADAVNLSVASLAFADAAKATELVAAAQGDTAQAIGARAFAILRLFEDGMFKKVSRKTVFELIRPLTDSYNWWAKNRTDGDASLFFYAYRFEAGVPADKLFAAGAPVYSPDINTYMILACQALAKLWGHLGNGPEAAQWNERAAKGLNALQKNLWDDKSKKFVGKNVYTGEIVEADAAIESVPLMLVKSLDFPKDWQVSFNTLTYKPIEWLCLIGKKTLGSIGENITEGSGAATAENGSGEGTLVTDPFHLAAILAFVSKEAKEGA